MEGGRWRQRRKKTAFLNIYTGRRYHGCGHEFGPLFLDSFVGGFACSYNMSRFIVIPLVLVRSWNVTRALIAFRLGMA